MLLLEHPPVYTVGAPLRRGRPAVRRGLLPRARDRRRAHAARRPAHLPRARAARRLPDHARRERARVHPHDGAGDRRRARRRGRRGRARKLGHKHVGVWVGERKIASVGVHISHGVSAHGFAVNVDNDLDPFSWVVACGLPEVQMTSMAAEGVAEGLACFRKRVGVPLLRGVRAPPAARQRRAARHRARWWRPDGRRARDLPHRRRHPPRRAGPARRGARLRVADGHRAHAHPGRRPGWSTRDGGAARRASTAAPTTRSSRSPSPPRRPRSWSIGTSVCLVIEHDPIVLAKEIASLQNLSGGRFVFGVGAGWNKQEMLNHGTDPATRHGNMRERVEAMKAIWAQRRGRIPRQARGLRPDLAVAEAASRAPPVLHRRQRPARRGPRAALRRRLDAEHEGARDARAADRRRCASAPAATSRSPTTARRRRTWTRCATRAWTAR